MIFNMITRGPAGSGIVVAAPAGSVVTCEKGSESRLAAESGGVWVFRGCGVGSWVITASLNGNVKTQTVEIQAQEQKFTYYVSVSFFEATISVTYPAGSTCTCAKGDVVLTAPDTSGSWVCTVAEAGDWVITATDGASSAGRAVTITQDGQRESLVLSYTIVLFDYGSQDVQWQYRKTGFAGHGNSGGSSEIEYNEDGSVSLKLSTVSTKDTAAVYETAADIDLTGISTLVLHCSGTDTGNSSNPGLAVYNRSVADPYNDAAAKAAFSLNTEQIETVSLDVSSLTGSYAVCIGIGSKLNVNGYRASSVTIYKLEGLA